MGGLDFSGDEEFRKLALEDLYIAIAPGGGGIHGVRDLEEKKRLLNLVDQLAVALVGGVPESVEEFT